MDLHKPWLQSLLAPACIRLSFGTKSSKSEGNLRENVGRTIRLWGHRKCYGQAMAAHPPCHPRRFHDYFILGIDASGCGVSLGARACRCPCYYDGGLWRLLDGGSPRAAKDHGSTLRNRYAATDCDSRLDAIGLRRQAVSNAIVRREIRRRRQQHRHQGEGPSENGRGMYSSRRRG